jgi:hypothetical protein
MSKHFDITHTIRSSLFRLNIYLRHTNIILEGKPLEQQRLRKLKRCDNNLNWILVK